MMQARDVDDPREFQRLTEEFAQRAEHRNFLFIGIAVSADQYRSFRGWVVEDDGEVRAAGLQTNDYNLVLSESDDPVAVRQLAQHIGPLPGVVGPRPAVDQFVAARLEESLVVMDQGVYVLTEVNDVDPAPGESRLATLDDVDLIVEWVMAFQAEALGEVDPEGIGRVVRTRVAGDNRSAGFMIYEDAGEIVSISGHSGPTGSGIKIAPVYTPSEKRGKGYATNLVADHSRWLLEHGYESCFLYTDMANPTSNSIYQRIGYRKVGEAAQYEFAPM